MEWFYTDSGAGPVALLLHGWACDSNDWIWQIPALETAGFRVIAVDHRGHGRSRATDGDYHAESLAADVESLLDAIGVAPAVVIGHSLGTVVASALNVRRPDLAPALVLVDPVYHFTDERLVDSLRILRGPSPREGAAALFRALLYTPDTPAHLITWHERRLLGTPEHVVRDTFLSLFSESDDAAIGRYEVATDYLRKRQAPRLAVYADQEATAFEHELGVGDGDEIRVIAGGHFLHQHRADEFNQLLLDWLERMRISPSGGRQSEAAAART